MFVFSATLSFCHLHQAAARTLVKTSVVLNILVTGFIVLSCASQLFSRYPFFFYVYII